MDTLSGFLVLIQWIDVFDESILYRLLHFQGFILLLVSYSAGLVLKQNPLSKLGLKVKKKESCCQAAWLAISLLCANIGYLVWKILKSGEVESVEHVLGFLFWEVATFGGTILWIGHSPSSSSSSLTSDDFMQSPDNQKPIELVNREVPQKSREQSSESIDAPEFGKEEGSRTPIEIDSSSSEN